jgi:diadenosine tetraphosphatase ApaH/serine/threonine PP2A family protein phosphatase
MSLPEFDVDQILATLESGSPILESQASTVLTKLKEVLYSEANVLELSSPITICGDIHGQLYDLFQLFESTAPRDGQTFLFLGDYVDRGYYSLETVFYLTSLKLRYPRNFFLLRGNHECRQVNKEYGFYPECLDRYGHPGIWLLCNEVFDLLPVAAVIDGRVFAVHGGLSPDIPVIEKISLLPRNDELPTSGPLCDLAWSDPDAHTDEWKMNQRGAGYLFGVRQTHDFCRLNGNLDFVVRSHQIAMEGFEWFFDRKLVIVWSAPNYMYRSGNLASVMKYEKEKGTDSELVVFREMDAEKRRTPGDFPPEPYFV